MTKGDSDYFLQVAPGPTFEPTKGLYGINNTHNYFHAEDTYGFTPYGQRMDEDFKKMVALFDDSVLDTVLGAGVDEESGDVITRSGVKLEGI